MTSNSHCPSPKGAACHADSSRQRAGGKPGLVSMQLAQTYFRRALYSFTWLHPSCYIQQRSSSCSEGTREVCLNTQGPEHTQACTVYSVSITGNRCPLSFRLRKKFSCILEHTFPFLSLCGDGVTLEVWTISGLVIYTLVLPRRAAPVRQTASEVCG